MTKSFKGVYVPFYTRLFKRLAPAIVILLLLLLKVCYSRSFNGELAAYRSYFFIFLAVCFVIGIYYHTDKIRTVTNEVRFTEGKLEILGHDFSSKFEDRLDLGKTMIEIQEDVSSKNKLRYCLEIYSEEKYYYLNKFNDWDYATLVGIVEEYESRTGKSVSGKDFYSALKTV